jgi:hypothetical protein
MSQDLVDALARMAQGGWDGLENAGAELRAAQSEVAKAEREEARRQARIFADCFETPAGRACLALLRDKTIERPPTVEDLDVTDLKAFALRSARRQGMAQLVWMIETALAHARGEAAKETTDG